MATNLSQQIPKIFHCITCDYKCSNKKDYNKHLMTRKHKVATNCQQNDPSLSPHVCTLCKKVYNDRSGLWRHKKKCTIANIPPENTVTHNSNHTEVQELKTIIRDLLKQNVVLQQNQLELQCTIKEMIPRIGNTTHTNSHNNNTFNIQMFLENECKNAISIQDFVKSIEINTSHLIAMSKDGYVDSISNVLIQALNKLAITDRPLHCTDLKRETVYIKDMEKWNKSSADSSIMNKVITNIENKHLLEVRNYILENPESQVLDTPENSFYHKVHWNSLGAGEENEKLNKKIYKKVLPGVKLEQQVA